MIPSLQGSTSRYFSLDGAASVTSRNSDHDVKGGNGRCWGGSQNSLDPMTFLPDLLRKLKASGVLRVDL